MLTTLSLVKTRLSMLETEIIHDALLAMLIAGVTTRFPRELNRVLKRMENFAQEFPARDQSVSLCCYPVESITRVEVKRWDYEDWRVCDELKWRVRPSGVIRFDRAPGDRDETARVIYTGGYVMPGAEVPAGAQHLPDDLLNAATEQVAYLFMNRNRLGVLRQWPRDGSYEQFSQVDLLPGVSAVLEKHRRL